MIFVIIIRACSTISILVLQIENKTNKLIIPSTVTEQLEHIYFGIRGHRCLIPEQSETFFFKGNVRCKPVINYQSPHRFRVTILVGTSWQLEKNHLRHLTTYVKGLISCYSMLCFSIRGCKNGHIYIYIIFLRSSKLIEEKQEQNKIENIYITWYLMFVQMGVRKGAGTQVFVFFKHV